MLKSELSLKQITDTIKSVSAAQASRYFKSELLDDDIYTSVVYLNIVQQTITALYQTGMDINTIGEIGDAIFQPIIVEEMERVGFLNVDEASI